MIRDRRSGAEPGGRRGCDFRASRSFAILWRSGHVIKRIIKGGPIDNPKQQRAFLLCPSGFVLDTITGTASGAVKRVVP